MSKKQGKLDNRLLDQIEVQSWKLKDLISKFYPDGVRVEFVKATQVGRIMESAPSLARYSEDERMQARINAITESVNTNESGSTIIEFTYSTQQFRGRSSIVKDVCIMFKVTSEDAPIFIYDVDEEIDTGLTPKFFIDADTREAFIVLEDIDYRCKKSDCDNSTFARLSELHAIFSGLYDDDKYMEAVYYMTSFSQEDGKCSVEKIYDMNIPLLDGLFMSCGSSGGDNDTSSSSSGKGDEPATGNDANA